MKRRWQKDVGQKYEAGRRRGRMTNEKSAMRPGSLGGKKMKQGEEEE
jgi:hypothetical protein